MKNNPFTGAAIGAWAIFLLTCLAGQFKHWAWALWVPWLSFATIAPLAWAWKHRKK